MSADNVIYVQYRRGWWKVWMDSASNDHPRPKSTDAKFKDRYEALGFAHDRYMREPMVEYGVRDLPPQDPEFGAE